MRNRIIAIVGLVVLAAVGVVAFNSYATWSPRAVTAAVLQVTDSKLVSAEGVVVPAERATLAFKIGGRVSEIRVREGDVVEAGTVLARLDDSALRAQVAQAEAAYAVAQA